LKLLTALSTRVDNRRFSRTDRLFGWSCQRAINLDRFHYGQAAAAFRHLNDRKKILPVGHDQRPPTLEENYVPRVQEECDDGFKEIFFFATWFKKK
jgi:hypothetical protein